MIEFTASICGMYDAASHNGDAGSLFIVSRSQLTSGGPRLTQRDSTQSSGYATRECR